MENGHNYKRRGLFDDFGSRFWYLGWTSHFSSRTESVAGGIDARIRQWFVRFCRYRTVRHRGCGLGNSLHSGTWFLMVRATSHVIDSCPCCKRPLEQQGLVFFDEITRIVFYKGKGTILSPHQYSVLKMLSKTGAMDSTAMVDRLYAADENGGPENAARVLNSTVHELNCRVGRLGIKVAGRGFGRLGKGRYMLVLE